MGKNRPRGGIGKYVTLLVFMLRLLIIIKFLIGISMNFCGRGRELFIFLKKRIGQKIKETNISEW